MNDVSIIIVNWNTKELLLNCIESLIKETKQHTIEIIVVDNASSDGSPNAVRQRFPNVKVIVNKSNLGFAKANNIGIKQSTGRYVCLVNSDIKALDGCVDRMCEYMDNNTSIGALGPKTVNEDMTFRLNIREFPSLWNSFCEAFALNIIFPKTRLFRTRLLINISQDSPSSVDTLSGCFLMVRQETLEEVGLLDERFFIYGEDKDWCKRFSNAGWDVKFFPDAQAIHYGGSSSSVAPLKYLIEMLKSDFEYWRKHHSWVAQKIYMLIMIFHYSFRAFGNACLGLIKKSDKKEVLNKVEGRMACIRWIITNKLFEKK